MSLRKRFLASFMAAAVDGSKALAKAIRRSFGRHTPNGPERLDPRRQAEPIKADRNGVPSFAHSPIPVGGEAIDVVLTFFMALLSFVDSTPRAYRLKASNAAPPFQHSPGQSLCGPEVWRKTGGEREFRVSAGASQSGGFLAKAGVYWGFLRARNAAAKVGRGRTGGAGGIRTLDTVSASRFFDNKLRVFGAPADMGTRLDRFRCGHSEVRLCGLITRTPAQN